VVLDFSGVYVLLTLRNPYLYTDDLYSAHIDTTGIQALMDTRDELERWADGPVEVRIDWRYSPVLATHNFSLVPLCDCPLPVDSSCARCGWLWNRKSRFHPECPRDRRNSSIQRGQSRRNHPQQRTVRP
jgi:hypothetical protein